MEAIKRIVIVGGGYGGVEAAKRLQKYIRRHSSVHVTLIDRNPYHTLMTELHEIAGSRTEPEAVQISYKRIFSGSPIDVVIDEITEIDFEKNTLKSKTAQYSYDYLILGTGGNPEFFGTPGVQDNSFTLWSLEDAIRIREHIEIRFREAAKEPDETSRKKLLTFAIAGAGFTGIELAGELIERANTLCRKYHIDRDEVRIVIIEAKDSILPIFEKKPQEAAARYLRKKGAEILLNAPIVKAEEGIIFLQDGTEIHAGTFVWTCGIQASEFTARIALTKGRKSNDTCSVASPEGIHGMAGCHFDDDERYIVGERGRVLVNDFMQSVDYKNVYLCGDMIWYVHQEKVLPQIVETALQTAETVAHNVIADIEGSTRKAFEPNYHGFMVSIGGKYGVAHVLGVSMYGFIAMAMKHFVNLHYLWSVAGFNAIWGYLQEEFFTIKNRRSIVGGHLAAKVPGYWILLMRVWLGLMWVFEGINKIGEGWFNFSGGSKSGWMFSRGVVQAGIANAAAPAASAAADATAAASDVAVVAASPVASASPDVTAAATDAVTVVAASPSPSPVVDAAAAASAPVAADTANNAVGAVSAAPVGPHDVWNLSGSILPPDSPLVVWFKKTFMDGIFAYFPFQFFQVMVVSTEMAIGLALMGGLLTWPAAIVSLGMCVIFTLSGLFMWSQLWFVFAAIVMLGGAGQILGLDYWVMPWLRDKWNASRLAKRTHLYSSEPIIRRKKKV